MVTPRLPPLSESEIERRLPVWCALSDLFLDTELQPRDYAAIARAARDAGFSLLETRAILEREVFPVFASNLMAVAGEWAGWPPEFVRERVVHALPRRPAGRAGLLTRVIHAPVYREIFKVCWPRIEATWTERD